MPILVATFGTPEDITSPGFHGTVFCFPVSVIDRDDIGTAKQALKVGSLQIRVEVSRSRESTWGFPSNDLLKVAFEIAKERLIKTMSSGTWKGGDLQVEVNTRTHRGPCPYDPALIQRPDGAVVEIEVHRRVGFEYGNNR